MRTCEHCGKTSDGSDRFGGPDPCLGHLPGVIAACCGHGKRVPSLWTDVMVYEGREAVEMMFELGGSPPDGPYPVVPARQLTDRLRERVA